MIHVNAIFLSRSPQDNPPVPAVKFLESVQSTAISTVTYRIPVRSIQAVPYSLVTVVTRVGIAATRRVGSHSNGIRYCRVSGSSQSKVVVDRAMDPLKALSDNPRVVG